MTADGAEVLTERTSVHVHLKPRSHRANLTEVYMSVYLPLLLFLLAMKNLKMKYERPFSIFSPTMENEKWTRVNGVVLPHSE